MCMKLLCSLFLFVTFSANASAVLSVKERLRLHLWTYGLEERPVAKKAPRVLPEELERALKKI